MAMDQIKVLNNTLATLTATNKQTVGGCDQSNGQKGSSSTEGE
jgi:hypothetical protein